MPDLHPDSLVRKLTLKPDSPFYAWLERELAHRFDLACCVGQDQFRREARAITRAGQIKGGGERHEKDDRHRIDDRSRYVLGWSNQAKIATLEAKDRVLQARLGETGQRLALLQKEQQQVRERLQALDKLEEYRDHAELDWRSSAAELATLQADVLITHEAPGYHDHGFKELDSLARRMGVRMTVHGHQHDNIDSSAHWDIRVSE